MSTGELPPPLALFRMVTGYYVSRSLHVVAELGIADLLAEGPLDADELGKRTGTNADGLRRVLRLLVTAGVFGEDADGRFMSTTLSHYLRSGVPGSMRAATRLFGGRTQDLWAELMHSVRTGEPATTLVYGTDSFTYTAQHPELAAIFDEAMADWTRQVAVAAAAAYDFGPFGTIVDVGGGNGTLLAGILAATPGPRGLVFDQPHVAERARAHVAALGLTDRCTAVAGDFFKEVPRGGNAYVLKHVIHDWNDERAIAILNACRRAMDPHAKLLIIEGIYPPRVDTSPVSRGAAANDVNMLVCTGGRQRSEPEFRALYTAAGFTLTRIVPTPPLATCVIEGVPTRA